MSADLYTLESIGGWFPAQAEGRTASGRAFYFRARHGVWSLSVAPTGGDVHAAVAQVDGCAVFRGKDSSHGAMHQDDIRAILDRCLAGVTA